MRRGVGTKQQLVKGASVGEARPGEGRRGSPFLFSRQGNRQIGGEGQDGHKTSKITSGFREVGECIKAGGQGHKAKTLLVEAAQHQENPTGNRAGSQTMKTKTKGQGKGQHWGNMPAPNNGFGNLHNRKGGSSMLTLLRTPRKE